jgi:hypothetical protein
LTVVVSMVSVSLVTAGTVLGTRFSKLPPVALVMVAFDLAGVFVDVVSRSWNGHGAGGFTGFDGDHRAVGQGHGHRRASRVGQGRGVDDRAFGHRVGGAQRQVGGVDGVRDVVLTGVLSATRFS